MSKIFDNRFFITIFAMLAPVINFIRRFISKRDVLYFLLGALTIVVAARMTIPDFHIGEVSEMPIEVVEARIEAPMAVPVANEEAENIARVLYGVKDYQLSENAKIAIIETIFSRVDCTYGEFGDTINEVCLKPQQWQGFIEDSSYLKEDYDLALNYINGDHTARVTPEGCYWFVVSNKGVTVRTDFNGGNTWTVE